MSPPPGYRRGGVARGVKGLPMRLGLGLVFNRPFHPLPQNLPARFDFSGASPALPSGWTYTRNDSVATQTDATGRLVPSVANAPRWVYGSGLRMEAGRTNLCANYNYNPADLTGLIAGGDAAAILAVVADGGNLLRAARWSSGAAIDLTGVCTAGRLIRLDNTGGTAPAWVEFNGSPADTNGHSASVFAAVSGGAGVGAQLGFGALASPRAAINANLSLTHIKLENFTPDSTSNRMRVWVNPGFVLLCILNQLEEGANASSIIRVAGAAAGRAADKLYDDQIAMRPYFNAAEGAVIVDVTLDDVINHPAQHLAILAQGTTLANCFSVYTQPGRSKLRTRLAVGSTAQYTQDTGSLDKARAHYPAGFTWKGSQAVIVSGALDNYTIGMSGPVTGLNRLDLCGRPYSENMNGVLRRVLIYKKQPTMAVIGRSLDFSNDWAVVTFGQSNIANLWNAPDDNNNLGEQAWIATLDQAYAGRRNWLIHAAVSGSSVLNPSNPLGYWRDGTTGNFGPLMTRALDMIAGFKAGGGRFYALHSNQGEADAGSSAAAIGGSWQACWARIQALTGTLPVGIECIGRRQDGAGSDAGYQILRELQQSLAATLPNTYLCPERFAQPMGTDVVHLTDPGYAAQSTLHARKMLNYQGVAVAGPVDGPGIAYAARSGTTLTVMLAYPAGITDVTSGADGTGCRFFDNQTEIALGNFTKVSAMQFTLTLASLPTSGVENFYYGYGVMYGIDYTKLMRGNDAYQLPLRAVHAVLPYGSPPVAAPSGFASGFAPGFH